MLKFVDAPEGGDSSLIHCQLEHVSLDDTTPEWQAFTLEPKPSIANAALLGEWIRKSFSGGVPAPDDDHLSVPFWRFACEHIWKMERIGEILKDLPQEMGMGELDLSPTPPTSRFDNPGSLDSSLSHSSKTSPMRGETFFRPRFPW